MKSQDAVSFSFGRNWKSFVRAMPADAAQRATRDIEEWLGGECVRGKTVVDIGCGSGLHSLSFFRLGAREIISIDVDPHSVAATRSLWRSEGSPSHWRVLHGSILDASLMRALSTFDIVYSWGVLHHTGAMWRAMDNACSLVGPGGSFWIALYAKGERYAADLEIKQNFNRAGWWGKRLMVAREITEIMKQERRAGHSPLNWNEQKERGMNTYHDLLDWLGGLPYEVAHQDEVAAFCAERGLLLEKMTLNPHNPVDGGNHIYLFLRPEESA